MGKKALVLGAIGQSIPDIDFVTSWWMPTAADLLAHRGFTHSMLFAILVSVLLAWSSKKIWQTLTMKQWCFFWGIQLFMHLFLDIFNVYGTGLFEPFSHYRVSLNTFFVLDPLFSLWPVLALPLLLASKKGSSRANKIATYPLMISGLYMAYSISNKLIITSSVEHDLAGKHMPVKRFFTTPTPLNNLLWYIVAETDSGFYTGYSSLLDKSPDIKYRFVPQNTQGQPQDNDELKRLKRFSQGYYVFSQFGDTTVFNDLRFGEMTAGLQPDPRFCFYYYLSPQLSNDVIIQRGRFKGWNRDMVYRFIGRIKGVK